MNCVKGGMDDGMHQVLFFDSRVYVISNWAA